MGPETYVFGTLFIHTVKDFGIINKAEIDVFLELSCFFNDPVDVGNLISGSSVFSMVKKPPAMHQTLVHFLGREDPLEKG